MKNYKYKLTTDDNCGISYVVVESDSLASLVEYAEQYTQNRPLMHLRLKCNENELAVVIAGKFYEQIPPERVAVNDADFRTLTDAGRVLREMLEHNPRYCAGGCYVESRCRRHADWDAAGRPDDEPMVDNKSCAAQRYKFYSVLPDNVIMERNNK